MSQEQRNERVPPSAPDADPPSEPAAEGATTPAEGAARPGATDVQAYIGRQLRAVYDDVVKQPIPDRFLALMKQLEEGSGQN